MEAEISPREFAIYALSLATGPNFGTYEIHTAVACQAGAGAVLFDLGSRSYGVIVLRRRIDHTYSTAYQRYGLASLEEARRQLQHHLRANDPSDPLPAGHKSRPLLMSLGARTPHHVFKLLTSSRSHIPALMTVGETYLAIPDPDENFVSDFQTENFESRLWELYLLAAFREQEIRVSHPFPSPDFLLERGGHECWVEAVTANPSGIRPTSLGPPVHAPTDMEERMSGAPAERFAKTLRSKLQKEYESAPHVRGKPFALALADFHAPSSMTWSREALPTYLYGELAKVVDGPNGPQAIAERIDHLRNAPHIPAGLFRDPSMSHLSAVVFSNAATIAKFNRMGFLAGWRPPGLKMTRQGILYDRTPGALKPIDFKLDVLSDEYAAMWPDGEHWCQELEVYHNPLATHPIEFDLIPGATHWFERDGEIVCSTIWEHSILASITLVEDR